jgi:hypothetical protein
LVTPVATPAENTVDDEHAISGSKEVANRTGTITHDEVDDRAHDEATVITNGLYTDIEDLLLSLGIQRPQLNSPKTKETSQRLIVPVGSIIVDGTVGPFIAKNEHIDKSLQEAMDECAEQAGKDDEPYPSCPPTRSDHPETPTLFLQR